MHAVTKARAIPAARRFRRGLLPGSVDSGDEHLDGNAEMDEHDVAGLGLRQEGERDDMTVV